MYVKFVNVSLIGVLIFVIAYLVLSLSWVSCWSDSLFFMSLVAFVLLMVFSLRKKAEGCLEREKNKTFLLDFEQVNTPTDLQR